MIEFQFVVKGVHAIHALVVYAIMKFDISFRCQQPFLWIIYTVLTRHSNQDSVI